MFRLVRFGIVLGVMVLSGLACSRPADATKADVPTDPPKKDGPGGDTPKKEVPQPPSKEIVEAWKKAGAKVVWFEITEFSIPQVYAIDKPAQAGWLPAFSIENWKEGMLKGLPSPDTAFALDLFKTQVTDAGLKELTNFKQLAWLDLRGTQITDAGLKELSQLGQLANLDLSYTSMTDAGLKETAQLKQLTTLDLYGTEVTDAGLKELTGLKRLTELNLRHTKVTDAGLKELQNALPKCEISK